MKIIIIEEKQDSLELIKKVPKEISNLIGPNFKVIIKRLYSQDNPVPSLDKIIGEIYREHYSMHRKRLFDFPEEEEWVEEQIKKFKLNFPELIQNGVETNNEQPKFKCTLEIPNFNKRIVITKNNKIISTSDWNHPEGTMIHIYNNMEFIQQGYNGKIYWRTLG